MFVGILIGPFSFPRSFEAMSIAYVSTQTGEKLESTVHLKDFLGGPSSVMVDDDHILLTRTKIFHLNLTKCCEIWH